MKSIEKQKAYLEILKMLCLTEEEIKRKRDKINIVNKFIKFLEDNNIYYDLCIRHNEVKGCDEASIYYKRYKDYLESNYVICKNLLVRERKGEKRTFLIITDSRKRIDLKALKEDFGCKKLEFVPKEEMKELINTTPGNVSLFNIMDDKNKKVNLVIDEELLDASSLAFHPLYNGMSMFLKPKECLKFLAVIDREAKFIPISEKEEKFHEKKLVV